METSTQDEFREPPCSKQGPLRRPQTPPQSPSPMSACSDAASSLHDINPPAYTRAPYLDSPPSSYCDSSPASTRPTSHTQHQQPFTFQIYSPTTDHTPSSRPSCSDDSDDSDDDDNVPLAQLLIYPRDEPPAYSTVVRHSYRETLLPHLPRQGVVVDLDEEAALERVHADDVSFTVERVVATAVVMALLLLTGLFVGLVFVRR